MPDLKSIRIFLDEPHHALARKAQAFCEEEIGPLPSATDDTEAREQAGFLLERMGLAGLYAPIGTQDLRGCCLVRETLAAASPLADAVFALQALGSMPILIAGTEEQQQAWLDRSLAGDVMTAFAMTEPDAGSDVASMTTSATLDGEEYTLEGTKSFISNAGLADVYCVFAVTDPARGSKGISCFLVPADAPGFRFIRPQILSSPHPLGEIGFDDCRIPVSNLLGREGEGLKLGLATLDRLRPTVGAAACGMAERALREASRHALVRQQFGKRLADFQLIQEKLARMHLDLTAARLLVYRAAWEKDQGAARIPVESAMAKAFATEAAQRIVDDAVQIQGGRGVLADNIVEHLYRAVRALRIYEGTTEVQHLILAGHWLREFEAKDRQRDGDGSGREHP
ncbi:MAG: acyl-CoA dehydrogenase family protein [Candidatus Eisenbacteria bacterium]|uniref:Medium-chain specific acyl-CoA dehydrogenase, mitochondrial n=1 Tax=Eiseniibacteriota bacterium TaxID=2212470 RepID=A0A956LZ38_UNCEI|nr:acyl-CoA dehydrogenase family protein [Candidatus Eisenbacteria bacterium]